jgi:hypothetical protein
LDEDPVERGKWRWIRHGRWTSSTIPDDLRHELAVWLAMPGFSTNYHATNLGVAWNTVRKYRQLLPDYDDLSGDVVENWLSVTREDAGLLCQRRPFKGDVPIICQLRMLDDLKAGRGFGAIAREYGVRREWLSRMRLQGISAARYHLPRGFELLVQNSQTLVAPEKLPIA